MYNVLFCINFYNKYNKYNYKYYNKYYKYKCFQNASYNKYTTKCVLVI